MTGMSKQGFKSYVLRFYTNNLSLVGVHWNRLVVNEQGTLNKCRAEEEERKLVRGIRM
jgi:hypothetical protein